MAEGSTNCLALNSSFSHVRYLFIPGQSCRYRYLDYTLAKAVVEDWPGSATLKLPIGKKLGSKEIDTGPFRNDKNQKLDMYTNATIQQRWRDSENQKGTAK
jgi:hypothetical protein